MTCTNYQFSYYRPQTKLREGYVFTAVCDSVHGGMRGFFLGVRGFFGGCMVFSGGWGHAWFFSGGAWFLGGHAWFFWGVCMVFSRGVRGFFSFFECIGYNEIRSMSGRYASYWNAFLFQDKHFCKILFNYFYKNVYLI